MDSPQLKRDTDGKGQSTFNYLPSNLIQSETLQPHVLNSQETAAKKIQAIWRGYRCRKAFLENKTKLKESKAAIIIQRSVRNWLHKKKSFILKTRDGASIYELEGIEESRLPALQEEIELWNKENGASFESPAKLQLQLETVQEQLKSFYEKATSRKNRMQYSEAMCAQIEAISSLLTVLPSFEQCDQTDISMFETPLVTDVRLATLRHKQELKVQSAPWWKRLNLQTESSL